MKLMTEEPITLIDKANLVAEAAKMKAQGYRLLTYTALDLDETTFEITYHFDKDLELVHLRLQIPRDESIPSLVPVYFAALLVENEIRDQYGATFDGLPLDFGGTLYLDEEASATPLRKVSYPPKAGAQ